MQEKAGNETFIIPNVNWTVNVNVNWTFSLQLKHKAVRLVLVVGVLLLQQVVQRIVYVRPQITCGRGGKKAVNDTIIIPNVNWTVNGNDSWTASLLLECETERLVFKY